MGWIRPSFWVELDPSHIRLIGMGSIRFLVWYEHKWMWYEIADTCRLSGSLSCSSSLCARPAPLPASQHIVRAAAVPVWPAVLPHRLSWCSLASHLYWCAALPTCSAAHSPHITHPLFLHACMPCEVRRRRCNGATQPRPPLLYARTAHRRHSKAPHDSRSPSSVRLRHEQEVGSPGFSDLEGWVNPHLERIFSMWDDPNPLLSQPNT